MEDDARPWIVVLDVPAWLFRVLWCFILTLRVVCGGFCLGASSVYWFLGRTEMTFYAQLLGPGASKHLSTVGLTYAAIGVAHCYQLARMVYSSARHRTFAFEGSRLPPAARPRQQLQQASAYVFPDNNTRRRSSLQSVATVVQQSHQSRQSYENHVGTTDVAIQPLRGSMLTRFLWTLIKRTWRRLFGRAGFFGVESEFFHTRFLVRELGEILSQLLQVYNSSTLIARRWINNLSVMLFVLNCCSTPIVELLCHRRQRQHLHRVADSPENDDPSTDTGTNVSEDVDILALERFLCLACDLVLDAGQSVVIPLVIFMPYFYQFDTTAFSFPEQMLYDDTRYVNMVMEGQQLFVVSFFDLMSTLIPQYSIYSCLTSMRALIKQHSTTITIVPETATLERTTSALRTQQGLVRFTQSRRHALATRQRQRMVVRVVLHAMTVVLGGGVLALHLRAQQTSTHLSDPACLQATCPWFTDKIACSVFEFDCHKRQTATIHEDSLGSIDANSVGVLAIKHCVALVMPTSIRQLRNLVGIELYNITIVSWGANSAITASSHPHLTFIAFARVNMTEIPPAVVHLDLPETLVDIEVCVSNLTHLPENVGDAWRALNALYVEKTLLDYYPEGLARTAVQELSLQGNRIQSLGLATTNDTTQISFPSSLALLSLSDNPLQALPHAMAAYRSITFLTLEYTLLMELPSWIDDVAHFADKIYLHGTPFCDELEASARADHGADAVISCVAHNDRGRGSYPLDLVTNRQSLK
ncbi:TPA: hypothetical protein N0F65_012095 [Lagenidium giganteum]|uniref:Leucine-rich repeat domain, L domain-like n=1 Tax=Lagenidium giganteum TaxID=4803 RepID=A0AAV2YT47_9STRA|nr:TPA: hypothetical protein N0F65_012095 [Lagenidium giganteum]